jgi:HlyD family secretion protein
MKTLWVLRGGAPVQIEVKTGLTDGTNTEIVSGDLNEDDQVVLEAQVGGTPVVDSHPSGGGNQMPRMRL